ADEKIHVRRRAALIAQARSRHRQKRAGPPTERPRSRPYAIWLQRTGTLTIFCRDLLHNLVVCGIRCSTGGTPPSVRMARYFAPFFRCCRTSREAAPSYQLFAASLEGNSYTVTPCTGPCPSKIR